MIRAAVGETIQRQRPAPSEGGTLRSRSGNLIHAWTSPENGDQLANFFHRGDRLLPQRASTVAGSSEMLCYAKRA